MCSVTTDASFISTPILSSYCCCSVAEHQFMLAVEADIMC